MAFYNGYFSATAGRAERLEILNYVKIGDRWRGGSKYSGEERRERKQVELAIDGPGGGERREMSAVIHVRHVKREGEPMRNTCVEREYSWCAKVIVVCSVNNKQSMSITVLLSCMKFQSCDIICFLRVRRGRETDGLLKVRCLYVQGSPSMNENQIINTLIRSACSRASNNGLLKVVCPYVCVSPSKYVNRIIDTEMRCACYRDSNDNLLKVRFFCVQYMSDLVCTKTSS